jgi:CheY-like chemotaxis protein
MSLRLLVTEKDPYVRRWLGHRAEELGIQIDFARSTGEARTSIQHRPPDCVVLDACSSTGDPAPLWQQLRQDPRTQHIPILLYSSSSRWQTVAEMAGSQVDGFIPRPFSPDSLVNAARSVAR